MQLGAGDPAIRHRAADPSQDTPTSAAPPFFIYAHLLIFFVSTLSSSASPVWHENG